MVYQATAPPTSSSFGGYSFWRFCTSTCVRPFSTSVCSFLATSSAESRNGWRSKSTDMMGYDAQRSGNVHKQCKQVKMSMTRKQERCLKEVWLRKNLTFSSSGRKSRALIDLGKILQSVHRFSRAPETQRTLCHWLRHCAPLRRRREPCQAKTSSLASDKRLGIRKLKPKDWVDRCVMGRLYTWLAEHASSPRLHANSNARRTTLGSRGAERDALASSWCRALVADFSRNKATQNHTSHTGPATEPAQTGSHSAPRHRSFVGAAAAPTSVRHSARLWLAETQKGLRLVTQGPARGESYDLHDEVWRLGKVLGS